MTGVCPDCGGEATTMAQDLDSNELVYTCPAGHTWVSDEPGQRPPVSSGRSEEKVT